MLSDIGQQIDSFKTTNNQNYWNSFLEIMISLYNHENLIFNQISLQFWLSLFKFHLSDVRTHLNYKPIASTLLTITPNKLVRQQFTSNYTFEFDSDEDYETFYLKFKADAIEFLKYLTGWLFK